MKIPVFTKWITLFFFAFSQIPSEAYSSAAAYQDIPNAGLMPGMKHKLVIAPEIGSVQKSWSPGDAGSGSWVIHVQDLHADYDAQKNISEILKSIRFFIKTNAPEDYDKGILIAMEGAEGSIDASFFSNFPDAQVRYDTADFYLSKARFTGPEFFKITHGDWPMDIFGIEDKELYLEHKEIYLRCMAQQEIWNSWLEKVRKKLSDLENESLDADSKNLIQNKKAFEAEKLGILEFSEFLSKSAAENNVDTSDLKQFALLAKMADLQKKTDTGRVEQERNALFQDLSRKFPKEELQEWVKKNLEYRLGRIDEADYYRDLKSLLGTEEWKKYAHLANYAELVQLKSDFDSSAFFSEMTDLENRLIEKSFRTPEEKSYLALANIEKLVSKLIVLNLTRQELQGFNASKIGFKPVLESFDFELPGNFGDFEKFYETAQKRDGVIYSQTMEAMKKSGRKIAVLVTGGFHTEGLTQRFQENAVAYTVITPQTKGVRQITEELYRARMMGKQSILENMLTGGGQTLHPGSFLKPLTRDPALAEEMMSALRYTFALMSGSLVEMNGKNAGEVLEEWREDNKRIFPELEDMEFFEGSLTKDGQRFVLVRIKDHFFVLSFSPADHAAAVTGAVLDAGNIGRWHVNVEPVNRGELGSFGKDAAEFAARYALENEIFSENFPEEKIYELFQGRSFIFMAAGTQAKVYVNRGHVVKVPYEGLSLGESEREFIGKLKILKILWNLYNRYERNWQVLITIKAQIKAVLNKFKPLKKESVDEIFRAAEIASGSFPDKVIPFRVVNAKRLNIQGIEKGKPAPSGGRVILQKKVKSFVIDDLKQMIERRDLEGAKKLVHQGVEFQAGLWKRGAIDADTGVQIFENYAVDEKGSIRIVDFGGVKDSFRAAEDFVIPRGEFAARVLKEMQGKLVIASEIGRTFMSELEKPHVIGFIATLRILEMNFDPETASELGKAYFQAISELFTQDNLEKSWGSELEEGKKPKHPEKGFFDPEMSEDEIAGVLSGKKFKKIGQGFESLVYYAGGKVVIKIPNQSFFIQRVSRVADRAAYWTRIFGGSFGVSDMAGFIVPAAQFVRHRWTMERDFSRIGPERVVTTYEVGLDRLRGLVVPFRFVSPKKFNIRISETDKKSADLTGKAVLQEKVNPNDFLWARLMKMYQENDVEGAKSLMRESTVFQTALWRRGVMDWDFANFDNLVLDKENNVRLLDTGGILEGKDTALDFFQRHASFSGEVYQKLKRGVSPSALILEIVSSGRIWRDQEVWNLSRLLVRMNHMFREKPEFGREVIQEWFKTVSETLTPESVEQNWEKDLVRDAVETVSGARKNIADTDVTLSEAHAASLEVLARKAPNKISLTASKDNSAFTYSLIEYAEKDSIGQILGKFGGAYHHTDTKDGTIYIFVRAGLKDKRIAVEHEEFEIVWEKKLLDEEKKLSAGEAPLWKKLGFKDIQKAAHILAWAEQISRNKWTSANSSSFVKSQIEEMSLDNLMRIITEDRKKHLSLIEGYLQPVVKDAGIKKIERFEKSVRKIAAEKTLREISGRQYFHESLWKADQKVLEELALFIPANFQDALREIEGIHKERKPQRRLENLMVRTMREAEHPQPAPKAEPGIGVFLSQEEDDLNLISANVSEDGLVYKMLLNFLLNPGSSKLLEEQPDIEFAILGKGSLRMSYLNALDGTYRLGDIAKSLHREIVTELAGEYAQYVRQVNARVVIIAPRPIVEEIQKQFEINFKKRAQAEINAIWKDWEARLSMLESEKNVDEKRVEAVREQVKHYRKVLDEIESARFPDVKTSTGYRRINPLYNTLGGLLRKADRASGKKRDEIITQCKAAVRQEYLGLARRFGYTGNQPFIWMEGRIKSLTDELAQTYASHGENYTDDRVTEIKYQLWELNLAMEERKTLNHLKHLPVRVRRDINLYGYLVKLKNKEKPTPAIQAKAENSIRYWLIRLGGNAALGAKAGEWVSLLSSGKNISAIRDLIADYDEKDRVIAEKMIRQMIDLANRTVPPSLIEYYSKDLESGYVADLVQRTQDIEEFKAQKISQKNVEINIDALRTGGIPSRIYKGGTHRERGAIPDPNHWVGRSRQRLSYLTYMMRVAEGAKGESLQAARERVILYFLNEHPEGKSHRDEIESYFKSFESELGDLRKTFRANRHKVDARILILLNRFVGDELNESEKKYFQSKLYALYKVFRLPRHAGFVRDDYFTFMVDRCFFTASEEDRIEPDRIKIWLDKERTLSADVEAVSTMKGDEHWTAYRDTRPGKDHTVYMIHVDMDYYQALDLLQRRLDILDDYDSTFFQAHEAIREAIARGVIEGKTPEETAKSIPGFIQEIEIDLNPHHFTGDELAAHNQKIADYLLKYITPNNLLEAGAAASLSEGAELMKEIKERALSAGKIKMKYMLVDEQVKLAKRANTNRKGRVGATIAFTEVISPNDIESSYNASGKAVETAKFAERLVGNRRLGHKGAVVKLGSREHIELERLAEKSRRERQEIIRQIEKSLPDLLGLPADADIPYGDVAQIIYRAHDAPRPTLPMAVANALINEISPEIAERLTTNKLVKLMRGLKLSLPSGTHHARKNIFDPAGVLTESESLEVAGIVSGMQIPQETETAGDTSVTFTMVTYDETDPGDRLGQIFNRFGGAYQAEFEGKNYIFISKNLWDKGIAIQHEILKIACVQKLKGHEEELLELGFDISRAAHVLAWVLQIVSRGWKNVENSKFLSDQLILLNRMGKLKDFLSEDRSAHRRLMRKFYPLLSPLMVSHYRDTEESIKKLETFENSARAYARSMLSQFGPGFIIDGRNSRYQILSLLGKGNMGQVWNAVDLSNMKEVAVKVDFGTSTKSSNSISLDTDSLDLGTDQGVSRLAKEGEAMQDVGEDIPAVYDFGSLPGVDFLVMEKAGIPLDDSDVYRELLMARKGSPTRILEAKAFFESLLNTVKKAHARGIIHRDIKPANILWNSLRRKPVLIDFGIAIKAPSVKRGVYKPEFAGALGFVAPDTFFTPGDRNSHEKYYFSELTEIFQIGVTFFELLMGRKAFPKGKFADFSEKLQAIQRLPAWVRSKWLTLVGVHWELLQILTRRAFDGVDLNAFHPQAIPLFRFVQEMLYNRIAELEEKFDKNLDLASGRPDLPLLDEDGNIQRRIQSVDEALHELSKITVRLDSAQVEEIANKIEEKWPILADRLRDAEGVTLTDFRESGAGYDYKAVTNSGDVIYFSMPKVEISPLRLSDELIGRPELSASTAAGHHARKNIGDEIGRITDDEMIQVRNALRGLNIPDKTETLGNAIVTYTLVEYDETEEGDVLGQIFKRFGGAYHASIKGKNYIFVSKNISDRETAIEHEKLKIAWVQRLQGSAADLIDLGFDISKAAHVLAWGEQIAKGEWGRAENAPFILQQLFLLNRSGEINRIISEDRTLHYRLMKEYLYLAVGFSPEACERVQDMLKHIGRFEATFRAYGRMMLESIVPGTVIKGGKSSYQILAHIGKGGMSQVWEAMDLTSRQIVAVKFYDEDKPAVPVTVLQGVDSFGSSEQTAVPPLKGAVEGLFLETMETDVPKVYDYGKGPVGNFLVMEKSGLPLPKSELASDIQRANLGSPTRILQAKAFFQNMLGIVEKAHGKGILHRDIKPGNILYRPDLRRPILIDFGIAVSGTGEIRQSKIVGTRGYIAPDTFYDAHLKDSSAKYVYSEVTEMFQLGSTFFELLAGRKAFPGRKFASRSGAFTNEIESFPKWKQRWLALVGMDWLLFQTLVNDPFEGIYESSSVNSQLLPLIMFVRAMLYNRIAVMGEDFNPRTDLPSGQSGLSLMDAGGNIQRRIQSVKEALDVLGKISVRLSSNQIQDIVDVIKDTYPIIAERLTSEKGITLTDFRESDTGYDYRAVTDKGEEIFFSMPKVEIKSQWAVEEASGQIVLDDSQPTNQKIVAGGARKSLVDADTELSPADLDGLMSHTQNAVQETVTREINGSSITYQLVEYEEEDTAGRLFRSKGIGGAYQLINSKDGKAYIYVLKGASDYEIALQHEELEIYWIQRLKEESKRLPEGQYPHWMQSGFKSIKQAAHVLAWAQQIALRNWTRAEDSEFIRNQLDSMTVEQRLALLSEDRSSHRALIKNYLTSEIDAPGIKHIRSFENSVIAMASIFSAKQLEEMAKKIEKTRPYIAMRWKNLAREVDYIEIKYLMYEDKHKKVYRAVDQDGLELDFEYPKMKMEIRSPVSGQTAVPAGGQLKIPGKKATARLQTPRAALLRIIDNYLSDRAREQYERLPITAVNKMPAGQEASFAYVEMNKEKDKITRIVVRQDLWERIRHDDDLVKSLQRHEYIENIVLNRAVYDGFLKKQDLQEHAHAITSEIEAAMEGTSVHLLMTRLIWLMTDEELAKIQPNHRNDSEGLFYEAVQSERRYRLLRQQAAKVTTQYKFAEGERNATLYLSNFLTRGGMSDAMRSAIQEILNEATTNDGTSKRRVKIVKLARPIEAYPGDKDPITHIEIQGVSFDENQEGDLKPSFGPETQDFDEDGKAEAKKINMSPKLTLFTDEVLQDFLYAHMFMTQKEYFNQTGNLFTVKTPMGWGEFFPLQVRGKRLGYAIYGLRKTQLKSRGIERFSEEAVAKYGRALRNLHDMGFIYHQPAGGNHFSSSAKSTVVLHDFSGMIPRRSLTGIQDLAYLAEDIKISIETLRAAMKDYFGKIPPSQRNRQEEENILNAFLEGYFKFDMEFKTADLENFLRLVGQIPEWGLMGESRQYNPVLTHLDMTVAGKFVNAPVLKAFKTPGTGSERAGPLNESKLNTIREFINSVDFKSISFEPVETLESKDTDDLAHYIDGKIFVRQDLWEKIQGDPDAQRVLQRHEYVENILIPRLVREGRLEQSDLENAHALASRIDTILESTPLHALMKHTIGLMTEVQLKAIQTDHPNDINQIFYKAVQDEIQKRQREKDASETLILTGEVYSPERLRQLADEVQKKYPDLARSLRGLAREVKYVKIVGVPKRDLDDWRFNIFPAENEDGIPIDFRWPAKLEAQTLPANVSGTPFSRGFIAKLERLILSPFWPRILSVCLFFVPLASCTTMKPQTAQAIIASQEEYYRQEAVAAFETIYKRMPDILDKAPNEGKKDVARFLTALRDGSKKVRVLNTPSAPSDEMGSAVIKMGPDEIELNYKKIKDYLEKNSVWLEITAIHESEHLNQTKELKELDQLFSTLFPPDLLELRDRDREGYFEFFLDRMKTDEEFKKKMFRYAFLRIDVEAKARLTQFKHIAYILNHYPEEEKEKVKYSRAVRDMEYITGEDGTVSLKKLWMTTLNVNGFKSDFPDPFLLILQFQMDEKKAPDTDLRAFNDLNAVERKTYFWDYPVKGLKPGELERLILEGRWLPEIVTPSIKQGAFKVPGVASPKTREIVPPWKVSLIQGYLRSGDFKGLNVDPPVDDLGEDHKNDFAHYQNGRVLILRKLWDEIQKAPDPEHVLHILCRHEWVENVLIPKLVDEGVLEAEDINDAHALTSAVDAAEEGTSFHDLMKYTVKSMTEEQLEAIGPDHPNDPDQAFYLATRVEWEKRLKKQADKISQSVSLEEGDRQVTLNINKDILKNNREQESLRRALLKIRDVIAYNRDEQEDQRSVTVKLDYPIQRFPHDPEPITHLQIKGVVFDATQPLSEHQGLGRARSLYFNNEGTMYVRNDGGKPQGGAWLKESLLEFLNTNELRHAAGDFQAGSPLLGKINVKYPVGWGEFPGLELRGRHMGFVVLGINDETIGERGVRPPSIVNFENYGRTLRSLHEAGFVHSFLHPGNIRIDEKHLPVLHDLADLQNIHSLSGNQKLGYLFSEMVYVLAQLSRYENGHEYSVAFLQGYFDDPEFKPGQRQMKAFQSYLNELSRLKIYQLQNSNPIWTRLKAVAKKLGAEVPPAKIVSKKAMGEEDLSFQDVAALQAMLRTSIKEKGTQKLTREDFDRLGISGVLERRNTAADYQEEHSKIVNALLSGESVDLTKPIQGRNLYEKAKVEVHVVDLGSERGFRLPGRKRPVYEWTEIDELNGEAVLRIYVTKAFLEANQGKPSVIAQNLIHPLVEDMLVPPVNPAAEKPSKGMPVRLIKTAGATHLEAVQHEAFYQADDFERQRAGMGFGILSDLSAWVLEEAAREGDWEYLRKMTEYWKIDREKYPNLDVAVRGRANSIYPQVLDKAWALILKDEKIILQILKGIKDKDKMVEFLRSLLLRNIEFHAADSTIASQARLEAPFPDIWLETFLANPNFSPSEFDEIARKALKGESRKAFLKKYQERMTRTLKNQGIEIKMPDQALEKASYISVLGALSGFPDWLVKVQPEIGSGEQKRSFRVKQWMTSLKINSKSLGKRFLERFKHIGFFNAIHYFGYDFMNRLSEYRGITRDFNTPLDYAIPLIPQAVFVYLLLFPIIFMPAFLVKKVREFRAGIGAFFTALFTLFMVFAVYPARMTRPEGITGDSWAHDILRWYYHADLPYNTTPSNHVTLAALAGLILYRGTTHPFRQIHLIIGAMIGLSTVFVKQHFVVDILSGWLVAYLSFKIWFDWTQYWMDPLRNFFKGRWKKSTSNFMKRIYVWLIGQLNWFKVSDLDRYPSLGIDIVQDIRNAKSVSNLQIAFDDSIKRKDRFVIREGVIYMHPDIVKESGGQEVFYENLYNKVLEHTALASRRYSLAKKQRDETFEEKLEHLTRKDIYELDESILNVLGGEEKAREWFKEWNLKYSFEDFKDALNALRVYFVMTPGNMGDRTIHVVDERIEDEHGKTIFQKGDVLLDYRMFDYLMTQAALTTEDAAGAENRDRYYRASVALLVEALHEHIHARLESDSLETSPLPEEVKKAGIEMNLEFVRDEALAGMIEDFKTISFDGMVWDIEKNELRLTNYGKLAKRYSLNELITNPENYPKIKEEWEAKGIKEIHWARSLGSYRVLHQLNVFFAGSPGHLPGDTGPVSFKDPRGYTHYVQMPQPGVLYVNRFNALDELPIAAPARVPPHIHENVDAAA